MKLTRLGHPKLLHFFLKIHFIIVALQCLVSSVHQSESAIHTSSLSWISFPFRSPQSTEQSFLCYPVGSLTGSLFYRQHQSCMYVNPSLPIHPTLSIHTFVLYVYFCFTNKIYTIFLDSIYTHQYADICFSLSDLLHLYDYFQVHPCLYKGPNFIHFCG